MLGSRFAALVLAGCLGCGSAGTRADHPAPDREQSAPRAPSARARAQFGKAFTGQARPTIVVVNRFPATQHVFIDWKRVGTVQAQSSATFEIDLGTHSVTSADSPDPDQNPVTVTESFEKGFSYRYEIVPE